jgi:hypothetical protein
MKNLIIRDLHEAWDKVWDDDWEEIWTQSWDIVKNQTSTEIRNKVYYERERLGSILWGQVWNRIKEQIHENCNP